MKESDPLMYTLLLSGAVLQFMNGGVTAFLGHNYMGRVGFFPDINKLCDL